MSKSTLRAVLAVATVLALAGGVTGCSGSGSAAPATVAITETAAPMPTPSAMPIEEVVELDPLAESLVQAGRTLVAGSEGFAPVEPRTVLDMATVKLEADVQVVQLSMAGGPAASQASPPVDEASIAADIAALYAAFGEVRSGVIETAVRVVNEETPDADQIVRDDLFTAITAQQAASATTATDDTPRQLLELVQKTRAAQDAQVVGAAAAEAARQAAANQGSSGGSSSGGGSGMTFTPVQMQPRPTTHYCADPVNFPDWCIDF